MDKIFRRGIFSVLGTTTILIAGEATADNCSSGERAALPSCGRAVSMGNSGKVEVFNLCSQSITVKLDVSGASDKRLDIKPGYGAEVNIGTTSRTVYEYPEVVNRDMNAYCCPKYSQCSFPSDQPIAKPVQGNTVPDAWSYAQKAKEDSRFKGFQ